MLAATCHGADTKTGMCDGGTVESKAGPMPPGFYSMDLTARPIRMLFGKGWLGKVGYTSSAFAKCGYGCDNYAALAKVVKEDGFNSFCFDVNGWETEAGKVVWDTKVHGWSHISNADMDLDLNAAEAAGMVPCVEMLTAGLANQRVAAEHPDWRMLNKDGNPSAYMGPLLDWNSPYWKNSVLPLYYEYARKYGSRTAGLVLWEPPMGWISQWTKSAAMKSGDQSIEKWMYSDQTAKWGELLATLRKADWKGKLIGGGWGAFEWEEQMWDGTVQQMSDGWNVIGAFNNGLVPIMMPELLIHADYQPHAYRRQDAHYVYRSLMYERSVFGDNIIPNMELSWDKRAMKPDELFRWILESYSAGFPSYSVVMAERLYLDTAIADEVKFRPLQRKIFKALNKLPYFGKPIVNYRFVVSADMEKRLMQTTSVAWISGDWNRDLWHSGDSCGVESLATGRDYKTDVWIANGPTTVAKKAGNTAPTIVVNVEPGDYDIKLSLLDSEAGKFSVWVDYSDGGSWQSLKIGNFEQIGTGDICSYAMHLPAQAFEKSADSDVAPGKQIRLRFWNSDGSWLNTPVKLQKIAFYRNGKLAAVSNLQGKTLWDWYVKDLSRLFKNTERTVCGGALVNERLTNLKNDELYGLTGDSVEVAVVPDGFTVPKSPDGHAIQRIDINQGEDMSALDGKVLQLVENGLSFKVGKKSPLVYANLTKRADGREFLTVINHGTDPGSIEIGINWTKTYELVNSNLLGMPASYSRSGTALSVKLNGYGAIVLSNRDGLQ